VLTEDVVVANGLAGSMAGVLPARGWLSRWLRGADAASATEASSPARPERLDELPVVQPVRVALASHEVDADDSADAKRAAPPAPVRTWPALLARVREVSQADCVFAVEGEGIVVARDGSYGRAEVERIAAHVSRSFDLLAPLTEIGSSVESVCVMFAEGRWLTAIRIRPDESQRVTIGIVGPFTIIQEDRQRIRRSFLRLFRDGLPPPEPSDAD
jgi:hypothetical protein